MRIILDTNVPFLKILGIWRLLLLLPLRVLSRCPTSTIFLHKKKTPTFTQHCDEAPFMNGEKRTRHTSIYNRIRKAKWAHVIRFRVLSAFGTRLELLEYIYIWRSPKYTQHTGRETHVQTIANNSLEMMDIMLLYDDMHLMNGLVPMVMRESEKNVL